MKKFATIIILFTTLFSTAQEKIEIPIIVNSNFEKEFKDVVDLNWSILFRGKLNKELRFEAEFLNGNSKYLVSYAKDGSVKAIQKSISINSLNENISTYLKDNYPTFELNEASFIIKEDEKIFYNVGISNASDFFILVFNEKGTFLFLTNLNDSI